MAGTKDAEDKLDSTDADEEMEYRKVGDNQYEKGGQSYCKAGGKYYKTYKGKDGQTYYEDDEGKAKMAKSSAAEKPSPQDGNEINEDDLQKALEQVVAAAEPEPEQTRKDQLLEKAMGEDLSDEERTELFGLMGGVPMEDKPEPLSKSATAALDTDRSETLKKSVEVSPFLSELHSGVKEGLEVLAEAIEKSDRRQGDFNFLLAKAVREVGLLAKSLDERMATIEEQPATKPKAIRKSGDHAASRRMANTDAPEDRISKAEALDEMERMNIEALQKGMDDRSSQITTAIAKYENSNHMSSKMRDLVVSRIRARRSAAA